MAKTYFDDVQAQRVSSFQVAASGVLASTLSTLGGGATAAQNHPAEVGAISCEGNAMSGVIETRYDDPLASESIQIKLSLPSGKRPRSVMLQAQGAFPAPSTSPVAMPAVVEGISEDGVVLIRVDDASTTRGVTVHYLAVGAA